MWVSSGMDGIDGLDVGDPVTAEQCRALLGAGCPDVLPSTRLTRLETLARAPADGELGCGSSVPGQSFLSSWASITMMPLGPRT